MISLKEILENRFDYEPGVLDAEVRNALMGGPCPVLALAIHEEKGWPIVAAAEDYQMTGDSFTGMDVIHFLNETPDEKYIDARGKHSKNEVLSMWSEFAHEGVVEMGYASKADVENQADSGHCSMSLEVAKTFVEPVIKQARKYDG